MNMIKSLKERYPLLFNIIVIAAIILAMAVVAHVVMQIGTRHGSRRTVPDFSGMPLTQAIEKARKCDLNLHINDSLFVPAYEGGIVLDQLPEGGVEVKPGRTVYITINSFRQKMVPVPYVAERSLRQAKNMLEIAGLQIEEIVYRPDIATNYVLQQQVAGVAITPESRIEAEMGSGVTLIVGLEADAGSAIVPQVVGMTLQGAKSRLWELGLNVGKVEFDEGINLLNEKDARVYAQTPVAEQAARPGSRVALSLSLDGEKITSRRAEAEKMARNMAKQRLEAEEHRADSLARTSFEEVISEKDEEPVSGQQDEEDDFFQ